MTAVPSQGADDTRRRLLEAAIEIAGQEGPAGVTYRSVAGRAGLAHSLVRHYFGTREALLAEALELAIARDLERTHLRSQTIESFVSDLGEEFDRAVDRHLLQFDVVLSAIRGQQPIESIRAAYDGYLAEVAETLRQVSIADPDGAWAAVIFAAIDGLTLQHNIYGSRARTERALEHLRDLLRLLASDATGNRPADDDPA